jgi:N utilization substance protein B
VKELTDGTIAHMDEIDGIIGRLSPKRQITRIPKLCLAIIRLAMYEMHWDDGTPVNAAVSEAVKLAEEYTPQSEDVRFINGVLGSYARELSGGKEGSSAS